MTRAELRQQAWDFFQVQAAQRLTTFNFYIAIASFLTTGLAASFTSHIDLPLLGFPAGILLVLVSFIFSKLDQRNRELIKGAENALRFFEARSIFVDPPGGVHVAKRFTLEHAEREAAKKAKKPFRFWSNKYSYHDCFKRLFWAFGIIGAVGMVLAVVRTWGWLPSCEPWL